MAEQKNEDGTLLRQTAFVTYFLVKDAAEQYVSASTLNKKLMCFEEKLA